MIDADAPLTKERIDFAVGQLRHLYVNLLREAKGEIADKLLSPQIAIIERWQREHESLRQQLAAVTQERDAFVRIAVGLQWMARRYADGRMTYAVGLMNDLTRELISLGAHVPDDPIAKTAFARDGDPRMQAYDDARADSPLRTGHDETMKENASHE